MYEVKMEKIQIKTMVDITNSGIFRFNQEKQLEYNQYKNWTTLLQAIGLRCLIQYDNNPTCELEDMRAQGFGLKYKGEHLVWAFTFFPDISNAYATENDPVGLLVEDLHQVPIIKNLKETINMNNAVFDTGTRQWCNTVIKML
jgi:hypothetical protein